MNQPLRNLLGILLLLASSVSLVHSQSIKPSGDSAIKTSGGVSPVSRRRPQPAAGLLVEDFSFFIKDFKIQHQSETNTLNISISYRYVVNIANSEYPDFRLLAKD